MANLKDNSWKTIEMGRRVPGAENSWEVLDPKTYRIDRPTVFCLSGNGTTTSRDANGFCKQAEGYLNLMRGKKGEKITDRVDLVGFKYAKNRESSEVGGLTAEFIEDFVVNTMLPLFVDENGNRLPLETARKHMSRVSFFTYCAGAQELSDIISRLNYELDAIGYQKFEIDLINNSTMNISFAPLDNNQCFIPSVRVVSAKDEMVGDDLGLMFTEAEIKELDGVYIRKDAVGKIYGATKPDAVAGGINIITSSLVNASTSEGDDHYSSIVSRDADWNISQFNRAGKMVRSPNADCVSQMMGWALCRAVENSEENYMGEGYIPNNFYTDLADEMQSIRESFSSEELRQNPEVLHARRKAIYDRARAEEVTRLSKDLSTYRAAKAVVYSEIARAGDFEAVARIFEKNNYYYIDEILPTINYLNLSEKKLLLTASQFKSAARERDRWSTMPAGSIMLHLKAAQSYAEIREILSNTGYSYATDFLPWLMSETDKGYPITKEESKQILRELKHSQDREVSRASRPKWDTLRADIAGLGEEFGFDDVARVMEDNDYYAATDILPEVSHKLNTAQMRAFIVMSRAKRDAVKERAKFVQFPTYDEMVDMLNNAGSLEEVMSILDKHNYCGIDVVLPAVMVLTDAEKSMILATRNRERTDSKTM